MLNQKNTPKKNISIKCMPKILRSKKEIDQLFKRNYMLHFVPTMGFLHDGHLNIVKQAKKNTDSKTLVSIFINPIQFSERADFESYPKDLKNDISKLKLLKTDFIFIPHKNFIPNSISKIKIGELSKILCGLDRKEHFDGVATVIMKFLTLLRPEYIYLGEKDFQQILVIRQLIKDYSINTNIRVIPTVREHGGLALSSRNRRLSEHQRSIAQKIYYELVELKSKINKKKIHLNELIKIKERLLKYGFKRINYLEIRKEKDLNLIDKNYNSCRIFISAIIDGVRLIDNLKLGKIRIIGKYISKL